MSKKREKPQTYTRERMSTDGAMQRVRAELGEAFDDYVVIVRSRNPDSLRWAYSNPQWAQGAIDKFMRDLP